MHRAVSDASLSVTVCTHSRSKRRNATHVSLYRRTKIMHTISFFKANSGDCGRWGIVNVVNLGRNKFPKEREKRQSGRELDYEDKEEEDSRKDDNIGLKQDVLMENQMVLALICAKSPKEEEDDSNVEIIGESDGDDSVNSQSKDDYAEAESSSSSSTTKGSTDSEEEEEYHGEIVIISASRKKITIRNRIPLLSLPQFIPNVACHPHTYLNKILIGSTIGELILLNVRTGKIIHLFTCLKRSKDKEVIGSKITTMEQSPAIDTIAIGTAAGKVHLINVRMDKLLFTLDHHQKKNDTSDGVTSLSFRTDSSALEYGIAPLAVGQSNGTISIWDLSPQSDDSDSGEDDYYNPPKKQREARRTLLTELKNIHVGGVSQLSYFRNEPLLLSTGYRSNSLLMHVFDSPNHSGRILRQRRGHISPPTLIRYQYTNDGISANMADGTDAACCQILSCGGGPVDTSLRMFSTARSVLDCEYSQGKGLEKKARKFNLKNGKNDLLLNEIEALAVRETKSRDWGDLITIHKGHALAYVWSTKRKTQTGPILRQDSWNVSAMKVAPPKEAHASSVTLSSCGNFAIVGTKGGMIYKYNVQSGLPRGSYPKKSNYDDDDYTKGGSEKTDGLAGNVNRTTKLLERSLKIHKLNNDREITKKEATVIERRRARWNKARHLNSAVTGVAVDGINKTLVSVGSDSKLIIWSFTKHIPLRNSPVALNAPATKLLHCRESGLIAVALNDYSVVMYDPSSSHMKPVRTFGKIGSEVRHFGPITDLCFGPDGRKLLTASLDSTIRVWDVPTHTCVDWLLFKSVPTSLTLSPTGEFLATSHEGKVGMSLWCDRTFFESVAVDGSAMIEEPCIMDEPQFVVEDEEDKIFGREREEEEGKFAAMITNRSDGNTANDTEVVPSSSTVVPKKEGLITFSNLPTMHWKNLFKLELVKARNKPKEGPKKPPTAPFFLQWHGSGDPSSGEMAGGSNVRKEESKKKEEQEEWEAVWSDNDEVENTNNKEVALSKRKRTDNTKVVIPETSNAVLQKDGGDTKRKKSIHFRSNLAYILTDCSSRKLNTTGMSTSSNCDNGTTFESVTEYLASMGPSAIDVALSDLCRGQHDLEEGLPLLCLAAEWLLEACTGKRRYEVVNSYLHRFLTLHATTIAGIDDVILSEDESDNGDKKMEHKDKRRALMDVILELRSIQRESMLKLRGKVKHTLCLLEHFSRII